MAEQVCNSFITENSTEQTLSLSLYTKMLFYVLRCFIYEKSSQYLTLLSLQFTLQKLSQVQQTT